MDPREFEQRKAEVSEGMFLVPTVNLDRLREYAERMNRKATKLGLTLRPVAVETRGEPEVLRVKRWHAGDIAGSGCSPSSWEHIEFVEVNVTGETPVLPGWEFVGVVDRLPSDDGQETTVFRMAPGAAIPERVKDTPAWCDHCRTNRYRKLTFLVKQSDTGEVKQVGSTCIRDYLGHESAEAVARYAELYLALMDLAESDPDSWDWDSADIRSAASAYVSVERFLPWVALAIREQGWVSKSKAWDEWKTATATVAESWQYDAERGQPGPRPESQDEEAAEAALEWAHDLSDDECDGSDYLYNIRQLATTGLMHRRKHVGLAASIVGSHRNELERRARDEWKKTVNPEPFGEVGKRYPLTLTCRFTREVESDYGVSVLHKLQDTEGHLFTWFASGAYAIEEGETVAVKATVKDHRAYNGDRETVLTRVKAV